MKCPAAPTDAASFLEILSSRTGLAWSALRDPGFAFSSAISDLDQLNKVWFGDNLVLFSGNRQDLNVQFYEGASGNIVVCRTTERSHSPIVINARESAVVISSTKYFHSRIFISGKRNLFFSGRDATCNSANFVLDGEGNAIVVGEGSMLSFSISVRATDSHAIFDISGLEQINPLGSIEIGPYVWLGEQVSLLKGAKVGAGSIIGAKSLVIGAIPECSLAVGVPAKVTRQNVSWTRSPNPPASEVSRRLDRLNAIRTSA